MQSKEVQFKRQDAITVSLTDGIDVNVYQQPKDQWLMAASDVARGYGVAVNTIRSAKDRHRSDFVEGIHYKSTVAIFDDASATRTTMWTKAGVVRLGFFIKSERAKMFRDWAEKVVLAVTAPQVTLPKARRRNHNRLTNQRLVEILALVALVDDKDVRKAIVHKLMPDMDIPAVQLQLPLEVKGGEQ